MRNRQGLRYLRGVLCGLALTAGAAAEAGRIATQRHTESQADDRSEALLTTMGRFLAARDQFSFVAEVVYDRPLPTGQLVETRERHEISVRRPGSLRATVLGENGVRLALLRDGVLTIADPVRRRYFEATAGGSLGDAVDVLVIDLGLSLPGADLVHEAPGRALLERVTGSEYLGVAPIEGRPCHHLAFTQEGLEWEIWIAAGVHPVPQRLVLRYSDRPGIPRFSMSADWDLSDVPYDESAFRFLERDSFDRMDSLSGLESQGGGR